MKMTLNRDYVLHHDSGLSIRFSKGEVTYVPPRMVADAVALGAEAVADDAAAVEQTMKEVAAAREEKAGRAEKIEEAVRKMVARNQRGDMTAAGRPNLNVLFQMTELRVTSEELEPIWSKVVKDLE